MHERPDHRDLATLPAFWVAAVARDRAGDTPPTEAARLLGRPAHIGPSFFDLTRNDPGHLTDLRLKASTDPVEVSSTALIETLGRAGLRQAIDDLPRVDHAVARLARVCGARAREPETCVPLAVVERYGADGDLLSQVLCCYVNYFGSWADASTIAEHVLARAAGLPKGDEAALLCMLSANVLAAGAADPRARRLYRASVERWFDPWERCVTSLRWATAEIKRLGDVDFGARLITRALTAARCLPDSGYTTSHQCLAEALLLNLQALVALRRGDADLASRRLARASARMGLVDDREVMLPADVVTRYRLMLVWNDVSLRLMRRDVEHAVELAGDAVRLTSDADAETTGEALAILGFCLLRADRPREAVHALDGARTNDVRALGPTHRRAIARLMALAYLESGDLAGTRSELDRLRSYEAAARDSVGTGMQPDLDSLQK